MIQPLIIIVFHQLLFQGMFFAKNILLSKKLDIKIRGKNKEAVISVLFFALFVGASLYLSLTGASAGKIEGITTLYIQVPALALILLSLVISAFALIGLRESWRVGVIENQKTELITSGIYRFSRNPYFVSYIMMFSGYTLLLQNLILLGLALFNTILIHLMILKEEKYLLGVHADSYEEYKNKVPRYF